jgi:hypothetical protein
LLRLFADDESVQQLLWKRLAFFELLEVGDRCRSRDGEEFCKLFALCKKSPRYFILSQYGTTLPFKNTGGVFTVVKGYKLSMIACDFSGLRQRPFSNDSFLERNKTGEFGFNRNALEPVAKVKS